MPGTGWESGLNRTGTSFAAPIIAGALALVKSKFPEATGNQLVQQLVHTTSSGKYAWDRDYGFGLVSMSKLLLSASAGPSGAAAATSSAGDTTPASAASASGGGVPVWVWPLGAVVLLAMAAAGTAANKRGSRSTTSGRSE